MRDVSRPQKVFTVLLVGSHKCGAERENHLPQPATHTCVSSVVGGFLGCEHPLLDHAELLLISQHPQVFLLRAALSVFSTQPVCVLGIALTQGTELCLCLQRAADSLAGPISRDWRVHKHPLC